MSSAGEHFGKRLDNFVASKETFAYIDAPVHSLSLNSRDKVLIATRATVGCLCLEPGPTPS